MVDIGKCVYDLELICQYKTRVMTHQSFEMDGQRYILAVMTPDMLAIVQQITEAVRDPRFDA
jgi:hypothetical protein